MYVIALLQDPHQDPQLHAGMGTTLGIVRICTHLYVQQHMCKTLTLHVSRVPQSPPVQVSIQPATCKS